LLVKAALNGTRTRREHPGVPLTPEEVAPEARAAVAAGAGALHVHVRDARGRESLAPEDVARTVDAIRAACPGVPVGVSTGAWIVPDPGQRLALVRAWEARPDFASVNVHEPGALALIRTLVDAGVGVEAGVWTPAAARVLVDSGLAEHCLRILLEPAEEPVDVAATLAGIEAALAGVGRPRLLHGLDASAWALVELAARRGYDTRTGLEDVLTLPDGTVASSNAALVAAARAIAQRVAPVSEAGPGAAQTQPPSTT
jgi:uncharacterized protein (DUF849 family)